MDPRAKVIEVSVRIEDVITEVLALKLDIDRSKSKILGNTQAALSFNHRIKLLVELKSLPHNAEIIL